MPDAAIELVSIEKGLPLKPPRFQMRNKHRAVNIFKFIAVSSIIRGAAKVCLRELYFAEGLCPVLGGPKHIYVAPLASIGYGFWFPTGEFSLAAKGAEERGRWLRSAREIGKEQIEGERLRGIQMMKILVPLNVRVRRKEGACFFKEVPRKVREGKDVFFGYLTSSV